MDYLKKLMSFIAAFTLAVCLQASAQSDIDANRMNRDINIMENILQEMFKTSWSSHGNTFQVHSGGAVVFGRGHDIRGTYLPGFGVIFNIPADRPGIVAFSRSDDDNFSFNFEYGGDEKGEKITEKSITNRIIEFLRDYGSTLGQLSGTDKIMVVYNVDTPEHRVRVFRSSEGETERNKIPTISVVAVMADLQAYRSGDIDAEELQNRLDISTAEANGNKHLDLKVMANIFKTAFEESDKKTFRVIGSVDYLKLDNFGALFSLDARYSESWGELHESLRVIRGELADTRIKLEKEIKAEKDKERVEEIAEQQEQKKEEVFKAYDQFLNSLKEYIVDYGRTLKSVESEQNILVSVTLSSRYDEIPERIDLQIQKSDLEAMDSGDISREQTINQINVRKY